LGGGESAAVTERKKRGAVSLIMVSVPEGTWRLRPPSPRVQASGLNGPGPGETAIPGVPLGPIQGCFDTRLMQERVDLQAAKRDKIYWTAASQGPSRLPNAP
jgi:hypothetical protein